METDTCRDDGCHRSRTTQNLRNLPRFASHYNLERLQSVWSDGVAASGSAGPTPVP